MVAMGEGGRWAFVALFVSWRRGLFIGGALFFVAFHSLVLSVQRSFSDILSFAIHFALTQI
jgi:hypothetical protein